jgi:hypothetical protein
VQLVPHLCLLLYDEELQSFGYTASTEMERALTYLANRVSCDGGSDDATISNKLCWHWRSRSRRCLHLCSSGCAVWCSLLVLGSCYGRHMQCLGEWLCGCPIFAAVALLCVVTDPPSLLDIF